MKKILYSFMFAGMAVFSGCMSGFLNINDDPNVVTEPTLPTLLTGFQRQLVYPDNLSNLNLVMPAITNHLTIKELENYGMSATTNYMTNTWMYLYVGAVPQADELIALAVAEDCMIYAGIAKLCKAYLYMNIVDLWGDVPFTQANDPDIFEPVADESAYIYNQLLLLIDEARANLADQQSANLQRPGGDDVIYSGDVERWGLFANTLELKMLVQSRKAKGSIDNWTGRLNALLTANQFIGNGQDFQFPHSATRSPVDERHQSYVAEYAGGQKSYFISPWFYEIMQGMTLNFPDNPLAGIADPRIPYYFVNQATATMSTANPVDYRNGAFISIMYNSNSGYEGGSQENYMTCVGIYPVGGRYDDGTFDPELNRPWLINENTGTGIAPNKMLQAYSVPFMLAELYLTGEAAGDASAALRQGIERSFFHVNAVCAAAAGSATVPALADDDFIDEVVQLFDDAPSDERRLEIVMTQKWIANFYNSFEAYADIRRTGYPRLLFDVAVNRQVWSPYLQQTAAEAGPAQFELKATAPFPRILFYSDTEVSSNRNMTNVDRDVAAHGNVFWDVQ